MMSLLRGLPVLALLLLSSTSGAQAQVLWNPYLPNYGPGFVPVPSYQYRYQIQRTPYGTSYRYWYQNSVTPMFFGPNYAINPYFPQQPIIIQQPQIIVQQPGVIGQPPINGGGAAGMGGGIRKNEFVPADVKPLVPAAAAIPGGPAAIGPAPMMPEKGAEVAPLPEAMPEGVARLLEAGRKAFANQQYGRASELFRKGAESGKDPMPYFLLAQSQFALGKYRESVGTLSAGMTLKPSWTDLKVNVRALYGKRPEIFDEHMKSLRDAVDSLRDDAPLQFLLGHQLWFDGKAAEANLWLEKAKAAGPDVTPAAMMAGGNK